MAHRRPASWGRLTGVGKLEDPPMSPASFFHCAPHQRGSNATTTPALFQAAVEQRKPLATQVKNQSAAPAPESEHGDTAGNIIGIWSVACGIVGFGLLIWLGM